MNATDQFHNDIVYVSMTCIIRAHLLSIVSSLSSHLPLQPAIAFCLRVLVVRHIAVQTAVFHCESTKIVGQLFIVSAMVDTADYCPLLPIWVHPVL